MTLVTYQRSGGGSLVSQTYNEPGIEKTIALGSGTDPYSALDRFGRMIDLRWTKGSTDLVRTEYDYDRVSNRLFERNLIAGRKGSNPRVDSLFGFDALNRMTSFQRGILNSAGTAVSNANLTQTFGLDETGNIEQFDVTTRPYLMQTRTHNSVNEITDISETAGDAWATPAHDDTGNMTAIPQPNDLTSAYDATWDAWNRLVKLEDSSVTVVEYQYDGNSRRIAKLLYDAGALDETRHVYYTAQSQAIEERIDATTSPEIQFVWNLGYVDDLLMRDRDVNRNGTMNHRAYALTDLRYSMAALSNASGAVIERFAYDAHGQAKALASNFVSRPSSNYDWEFRYTGRRQDLETGLMYFRARYYSTELGRFISRDPLGFVDGMSLYRAYFAPGGIDPEGLVSSDQFVAGLLALLDAFTPRVGVRQCFRACTRVITPPIGCVCVTVCGEADLRKCCVEDDNCCNGRRKVCNVSRVEVNVGLYSCNSLGGRGFAVPPFPAFQTAWMPALKRPGAGVGGISNSSCPREGLSGSICITASAGFSTWTYGARGCYDVISGDVTIDTGFGVGTGTGVSGGGAITHTTCFLNAGCCN
jgi:RHS repeat-associated protein